jgi:hypothetical protein
LLIVASSDFRVVSRNQQRRLSPFSALVARYGIAVPQSLSWWSKTSHQSFDLRCDLGFVNEQNRTIIEKELAAEPIPAPTELDLISPNSFGIERQGHGLSE